MANLAVVLMQKGQPALLYLVPCTLGVMVWMARGRQELQDLWHGPAALTPPYFSASLLGMTPREAGGVDGDDGSDATGDGGQDGEYRPMGGTIAVLPPLTHDASSRTGYDSSVAESTATM